MPTSTQDSSLLPQMSSSPHTLPNQRFAKTIMSERMLADRVWKPRSTGGAVERLVLLSVIGSLFIAVCGHFSFSVLGIQSTLQTFAVMFVGLSCGVQVGLGSVALWLFQGAFGLPVFANGVGMSYMIGPTAGYFAGFFPAVALVGWYAHGGIARGNVIISGLKLAVIVTLAHAFIYICGLFWLHQFIMAELDAKGLLATENWILRTVQVGMLPFLPGDAVKIGLVVGLMHCLHSCLSFEFFGKRFETRFRECSDLSKGASESGDIASMKKEN